MKEKVFEFVKKVVLSSHFNVAVGAFVIGLLVGAALK